jgi:hypothetical protein
LKDWSKKPPMSTNNILHSQAKLSFHFRQKKEIEREKDRMIKGQKKKRVARKE